jgi:hypothetical protein
VYTGTRVRIQRIFFQKKGDRPFSNPYPFTRLYPGTGTGTAGTGHGYGLYPAGFSKPLPAGKNKFIINFVIVTHLSQKKSNFCSACKTFEILQNTGSSFNELSPNDRSWPQLHHICSSWEKLLLKIICLIKRVHIQLAYTNLKIRSEPHSMPIELLFFSKQYKLKT